jgi:3-deoxy-7-phosphoheptulonate synthase
MIVVMQMGVEQAKLDAVIERIEALGYRAHVSSGDERTIIGVIGNDRPLSAADFRSLPGVERAVPILKPYKLASRDFNDTATRIPIGSVEIGGPGIVFMAGPCSVEGHDEAFEAAGHIAGMGIPAFRAGAFKPRTSPYSFQGMGEEGLKILADIRDQTGMAIVTEVMAEDEVEMVAKYADVLQIGTRNMQNYRLLEAVGEIRTPVLLKRGMSATIEELLLAGEYILSGGNEQVMLCERGIRTYEPSTRGTFDLNAVPLLRGLTHLPVVIDPSHATGRWDLVEAVTLGGIAAGADGVLIEVHPDPANALSDGGQTLKVERFATLIEKAQRVATAIDRTIARTAVNAG